MLYDGMALFLSSFKYFRLTIMELSPLTPAFLNLIHILFHLVSMHLLHIGLMLTQEQKMEEMYFIEKQPIVLFLIELQ